MGSLRRRLGQAAVGVGLAGAAWFTLTGTASAAPNPPACTDPAAVTNVTFSDQDGNSAAAVSGTPVPDGIVDPGDTITVEFDVISTAKCRSGVELSLVSYGTQTAVYVPGAPQQLFGADTTTFAPGGPYTLTVQVPEAGTGGSGDTGGAQKNPNAVCDGSDNSDTGHGANQGGPYDNTCPDGASQNGKSTDNNSSKPCAGCVGNADDKNPGAVKQTNGQYPNGTDRNAGYECDRNQGIGQSNPAHTGCGGSPHYQLDFVSGQPITDFTQTCYSCENRLINWANG